jgi:hypothetical protein
MAIDIVTQARESTEVQGALAKAYFKKPDSNTCVYIYIYTYI